MSRPSPLIGLAMAASLGLVLSAQAPLGTRQPRADLVEAVRAAARLGTDHVPGRVLVKFRSGLPTQARTAAVTRALAGTGARLGDDADPYADFTVVDVPFETDVPSAAAALAARPEVEYAEPDTFQKPRLTPSDPLYPRQWHMRAINLERGWDINDGARDVVVAVLDSGLAMAADVLRWERFFQGRLQLIEVPYGRATDIVSDGRIVSPWDFLYDDDIPYDMDGHGTHVTGTIAQRVNSESGVGVAFNARIMPLKICLGEWEVLFLLARDGISTVPPAFEGGVCFTSDEARAIRYAADNGARVINLSVGGSQPSSATRDALAYAVSRGAFVAIAAGNEYEDGNPRSYPAAYASEIQGVMAVGAVGQDLNRAYYSTTGDFVEIVAPGGNIRQGGLDGLIWQQTYRASAIATNQLAPRFDVIDDDGLQGSSMASPHVAGLAALLYSQGVRNPAAIEAAIKRFARDRGPVGRDDEYGYGLIDVPATLRGLGLAR